MGKLLVVGVVSGSWSPVITSVSSCSLFIGSVVFDHEGAFGVDIVAVGVDIVAVRWLFSFLRSHIADSEDGD